MSTALFLVIFGLLVPLPGGSTCLLADNGYSKNIGDMGELLGVMRRGSAAGIGPIIITTSNNDDRIGIVVVETPLKATDLSTRLGAAGCVVKKEGSPCWSALAQPDIYVRICGHSMILWNSRFNSASRGVDQICSITEKKAAIPIEKDGK